MKEISIVFGGLTDPGILNKKNEDSVACKTKNIGGSDCGFFAIADGVGGLMNGDVASRMATSNMAACWDSVTGSECRHEAVSQALMACVERTNLDIMNLSKQQGKKMATTLSALAITGNEGFIAHIGDSRIYRFHRGLLGAGFQQLTKDHSCMVRTETDGRVYQKSVLTECLGYKEAIHPYYSTFSLYRGDIYFICSDGAYKTMTNDNLKRIISESADMPSVCHNIVNQAKVNNEKDNISVIAINVN